MLSRGEAEENQTYGKEDEVNALKRGAAAASIGVLALTTAACGGSNGSNDKYGCRPVQDDLTAVYQLADRWGYGNATNGEMLDLLQGLEQTAGDQMAAADTVEFKSATGDVRDAARDMYRAVNTSVGQETAAKALVASGNQLKTLCAKLNA